MTEFLSGKFFRCYINMLKEWKKTVWRREYINVNVMVEEGEWGGQEEGE